VRILHSKLVAGQVVILYRLQVLRSSLSSVHNYVSVEIEETIFGYSLLIFRDFHVNARRAAHIVCPKLRAVFDKEEVEKR